MARIRIFLVLVLALTAGGAFAFGTYRYIQQVPERAEGGRRGSAAGDSRWYAGPVGAG